MEAVDQVIQLVNGILQDVLGNPPVTPTKASIHSRLAVLLPRKQTSTNILSTFLRQGDGDAIVAHVFLTAKVGPAVGNDD